MARTYADFRSLIDDLIARHHGGSVLDFAKTLGVSGSLVYHWRTGFVTRPADKNVTQLCALYHLDPDMVWDLLKPRRPAGAAALPFPLPDERSTSDKKRYTLRRSRGKSLQNRRIMSGCPGLTFLRGCTPIGELPLAA